MDYFSIDLLIVYAFLLITLVIGLRAGRGIKDMREYAIANKMYGTGVLTITFLATYLGGHNTIGTQKSILSYGLIAGLTVLGSAIMLVYSGAYIVPKMLRFQKSITLGDLMQELYGPYGGITTGIIGCLYTISLVGVQALAMGHICESLLGWEVHWTTGLGGLILIIYASFGGVKSVTITDIFQFIVFVIVIPLIANTAISEVGGIKELFSNLPVDKLTVYKHEQYPRYFATFLVWCLFPAALSAPPVVQRILMARHRKQATNMLFTSAAFILFVRALLILTCMAVLLLEPKIKPSSGGAFAYVINQYFSPFLKGLSVAGLLAVVMSTLDSFLNAGGILFTHNVIKPLCDRHKIAFNELKSVRYITFLMGGFGILAAFGVEEVRTLSYFGMSSFAPVITIPLIAGILGLKTDTQSFLIACLLTLISFILTNLLLTAEIKYLVFPICLVVNAISFFAVHIAKNKGIAIVKQGDDAVKLWVPKRNSSEKQFNRILQLPRHIGHYLKIQLYKYDTSHILFALFVCFNYMVPYFMYTRRGETTMFTIKLIGTILCVGLLLKPYWNNWLKKYFYLYWYFSLLYCLPFTTTVLYLLNAGGTEWTVNIALSIMLLIVLVDWKSFIIISLSGIGLGVLCLRPTSLSYEKTYSLVYAVFFSTLIGLLFARRKQKSFDTLAMQRDYLAQDNQEAQKELLSATEAQIGFVHVLKKVGIEELGSAAHLSKQLLAKSKEQGRDDFTEYLQQLTDQLTPMALRLDKLSHRTTEFLRLEGVVKLLLKDFLNGLQQDLQERGYKPQIAVRSLQKELQCDIEKIQKVIVNSFAFLRSVAREEAPLLLGVEDTSLGYSVDSVSPDHIKTVPALRFVITTASTLPLPKPEGLYMSQIGEASRIKPESATDLPLLTNERIVKAHYGYSSTISKDKDLTLVYVIPVNIREVRSKEIDAPQMQDDASWSRADDTYPGAQEQEQAFLQAVKERSQADLSLVAKAIAVIKDYHGPVSRKSGEPFYLHPLAVAQIVLAYNTDEATVLGALLHDTVEDTPLTLEQIALLFNKEVSDIVGGVTHMESHQATTYKVLLSHPENIHRLLGEEDQRVLCVKLADRMHNMRTIQAKPYASQRRTSEETLLFFVPLAKYLGLTEAAEELKSRSFGVLGK